MGNSGTLHFGFQWYVGEPTVIKNIIPGGEDIGKFEFFKGPFLTGRRCISCRKVFLDY